MQRPELPWRGECRCGRVQVRVSKPPLLAMACHCTGCQHMTASAFSLSVAIPTDGFEVVQGETEIGGLHGEVRHHFCGWCMSWLFSKLPGQEWFVIVRTPVLEEAKALPPFVEICTSEKLPWATTPAKHSFEGFPPMEAYEGLIREYQADG